MIKINKFVNKSELSLNIKHLLSVHQIILFQNIKKNKISKKAFFPETLNKKTGIIFSRNTN